MLVMRWLFCHKFQGVLKVNGCFLFTDDEICIALLPWITTLFQINFLPTHPSLAKQTESFKYCWILNRIDAVYFRHSLDFFILHVKFVNNRVWSLFCDHYFKWQFSYVLVAFSVQTCDFRLAQTFACETSPLFVLLILLYRLSIPKLSSFCVHCL